MFIRNLQLAAVFKKGVPLHRRQRHKRRVVLALFFLAQRDLKRYGKRNIRRKFEKGGRGRHPHVAKDLVFIFNGWQPAVNIPVAVIRKFVLVRRLVEINKIFLVDLPAPALVQ